MNRVIVAQSSSSSKAAYETTSISEAVVLTRRTNFPRLTKHALMTLVSFGSYKDAANAERTLEQWAEAMQMSVRSLRAAIKPAADVLIRKDRGCEATYSPDVAALRALVEQLEEKPTEICMVSTETPTEICRVSAAETPTRVCRVSPETPQISVRNPTKNGHAYKELFGSSFRNDGTTTLCVDCGATDFTVRFKPTPGMPLRCPTCYRDKRQSDERGSGPPVKSAVATDHYLDDLRDFKRSAPPPGDWRSWAAPASSSAAVN